MNIPVKSSVKYLGIFVTNFFLERQNLHFSSRLKKTKAVLNGYTVIFPFMVVPYYPKQKAYLDLFIPLYHYMLKILTARILIICSFFYLEK